MTAEINVFFLKIVLYVNLRPESKSNLVSERIKEERRQTIDNHLVIDFESEAFAASSYEALILMGLGFVSRFVNSASDSVR